MVGTTRDIETGTSPMSLTKPRGRKLGLWMATALVVGNMIGSGVFLLPSSLASYGGVSLVAWVVTAAGAMTLAIVFARLGRAFPRTGGPYAYSRRAFGDFVGLESATVPAEDVDDPERTIPRSTLIGTAVTAVVYILGTVAVMGVLSSGALAGSAAPFADAADQMWGGWAGDAVAVGAVISAFGALNGWVLLQGQVPMAAARDRLFPAAFARTTRSGTPVFGLVVPSVLVTGLMAMNYAKSLVDQFTFVILLATLTTLVPYAYSAAAEVMLMITDRAAFSMRRPATDALVAGLAFAYSLWTIAGSGYQVMFRGFMLLMAGVPVYVFMKWRGLQAEATEAAEAATPPSDGEQPLDLTA